MHDHVRTELQWSLQVGAGEGVVDDELRRGSGILECCGGGGDVGDRQHRVGGGLQPHQPGLRSQRGNDGCGIGGVDDGELHTPVTESGVQQTEGATVGVVAEDDVLAGLQQGAQQGVGGGHARGEGAAEAGTLQGGDGLLEGGDGGVSAAGVFETAAQLGDAVLRIGGGGVDRDVDRTGLSVRLVTGMDGVCVEAVGAAGRIGQPIAGGEGGGAAGGGPGIGAGLVLGRALGVVNTGHRVILLLLLPTAR